MVREGTDEGHEEQQFKELEGQVRVIKWERSWTEPQETSLDEMSGVKTESVKSIIAKTRLLSDVD